MNEIRYVIFFNIYLDHKLSHTHLSLKASTSVCPQATAGVSGPQRLWVSGPASSAKWLEHPALPQDAAAGGKSFRACVFIPRTDCGQPPAAFLSGHLMDFPGGEDSL